MLSAEQARRATLKVIINDKSYIELKSLVADSIQNAVDEGEFQIHVSFHTAEYEHVEIIIAELRKLGYNVLYDSYDNTGLIRWKS